MNPPERPANAAQLTSPSYRLAALDQDFPLGASMRGLCFLVEFAKVDEALYAAARLELFSFANSAEAVWDALLAGGLQIGGAASRAAEDLGGIGPEVA